MILQPESHDFTAEDLSFDARYPAFIRSVSRRFWTPVAVARRAAALFAKFRVRRVLDVGGGAGKFALVAASTAPQIEWFAVEHRPYLVEAAEGLRRQLKIGSATFLAGDATQLSWAPFDGFYFFNSLAENLFPREGWFDDGVELSGARFIRDGLSVERALREAPVGTYLLTYHGSSVRIPACYELIHAEHAGCDVLRVWAKKSTDDKGGSFFVETPEGVVFHRDEK
jgi:SAM-dependent methyltransferase